MAKVYEKGCYFKSLSDIRGKKVTVMGLGLNGGGEACVRFFLKHGAQVIVTDMKTMAQLKPTVDSIMNDSSLDHSNLTFRLGEHREEDFSSADVVIKNPGVKYDGNKYLALAKHIETDLSIFLSFSEAPIIAVTGSKGKSSTVSAIHYGLKQAGYNAFLGGNITVSPLTFLEETNLETPVVIEFSSWQLSDLRGRGILKPHISIITKIVPDHQNWYGNMESYVDDKKLIYADQDMGCYSIFDNGGDEPGTGPKNSATWGEEFAHESKGTILRYGDSKLPEGTYGVWQDTDENGAWCGKVLFPQMSEPEIILRDLKVPGEHMKINVLNAALAMYLMGISAEKTCQILGSFTGIEHRLQYFHSYSIGSRKYMFYNDTCATVPEATVAAATSFGKPVILLTGGTDKGLEFTKLSDYLTEKNVPKGSNPVQTLYLLAGTGTDKLLPALKKAGVRYNGPYESLEKMLEAVKKDISKPDYENVTSGGSIPVVFSPGATSFGMFTNEFDRGHKFMDGVKKLFE